MPITMPRHHPEILVTEFLRDALAGDALGVLELEAKARATGLLGEGQCITNMKVFKRAKKSLGITSRRTGFGARSQWLWQLPPRRAGELEALKLAVIRQVGERLIVEIYDLAEVDRRPRHRLILAGSGCWDMTRDNESKRDAGADATVLTVTRPTLGGDVCPSQNRPDGCP
jgi:hypothetical protein